MSREVKFRAWHHIVGRMSEPFTLEDQNLRFMQFTGLLDKNGKEVYEGDIVKGMWVSEIVFEDGRFKMKDNEELLETCVEYLEIIGNIYENEDILR